MSLDPAAGGSTAPDPEMCYLHLMATMKIASLPASIAAAAIMLAAVAACSSSPSSSPPTPSSTDAAAQRAVDGGPLLVQCALSRGLMQRPSGDNPWLHGTKVVITASNATSFNEWYAMNLATVIAGRALSAWVQSAAANDKLPPQVCGPSASASALQKQVFAHSPNAGDPWGT